MAFSINEFKSTLNKYGGPGHTGLFEVQFINPPFVFGSNARPRDLTFFCKSVAIPGLELRVAEYNAMAQRPKTFVKGMNSTPVNAQFLLDSNHQIQKFLTGWVQSVVNFSVKNGNFSEVNGMLPYEIGYKDEYACTMVIRHYTTYQSKDRKGFIERLLNPTYYEVVLRNAFPVAVGDVDLAWENTDQYATTGVAFAYDDIQYAGERGGLPTGRLSRGNGLLGILETIGTLSKVVDTGFRPDGINDAINRLNRVNSAFDNMTRSLNSVGG